MLQQVPQQCFAQQRTRRGLLSRLVVERRLGRKLGPLSWVLVSTKGVSKEVQQWGMEQVCE